MGGKKRSWVSILIAAVIIVGILGMTVIGGAVYWVYRHVNTQDASSQSAAEQLQRQRAQFAGQEALLGLDGQLVVHLRRRAVLNAASAAKPSVLHVMAYDPEGGKLVRFNIPLWLLSFAPSMQFRVFGTRVRSNDGRSLVLTVKDLEDAGPGLVLDKRETAEGGEAIIWTD